VIETGWVGDELPVSAHLRTVAEILNQPPLPEERRALRREAAEAEAGRAQAQDFADSVAARGFMDRLNGRPGRGAADVLAEAGRDPFRDTEALARRRAAIDALKPLGLDDVITGGQSGCVLDANLGILEPVEDRSARSARAAMDRTYELERSQREADARTRFVARAKVQLDERRRALGLDSPRVSYRSAVPDAETVYRRACAEIGDPVCAIDGQVHADAVRFR
jgi:hypothetical protein